MTACLCLSLLLTADLALTDLNRPTKEEVEEMTAYVKERGPPELHCRDGRGGSLLISVLSVPL